MLNITIYSRNGITFKHNYILNNEPINKVTSTKDLGVLFKFNLDFSEYVDYIIAKAIKKLSYFKFRTKKIYHSNILLILYNSLVKSILMYYSTV